MCNPGLGFKAPAEARVGNYIDKKCPFTGKVNLDNLWCMEYTEYNVSTLLILVVFSAVLLVMNGTCFMLDGGVVITISMNLGCLIRRLSHLANNKYSLIEDSMWPFSGVHPWPYPHRCGGQAEDEQDRRHQEGLPSLRQEIQQVLLTPLVNFHMATFA